MFDMPEQGGSLKSSGTLISSPQKHSRCIILYFQHISDREGASGEKSPLLGDKSAPGKDYRSM